MISAGHAMSLFPPHTVPVKRPAILPNPLALTALVTRSREPPRRRARFSFASAKTRVPSCYTGTGRTGPARKRTSGFNIHSEMLPFPSATAIPGTAVCKKGPREMESRVNRPCARRRDMAHTTSERNVQ